MTTHGPGVRADAEAPVERWGGRRAQAMVRACLDLYGPVCWLCGLPGATTADHVVPIARGGAVYDLANLGPAHASCNYRRGAKPAEEFDEVESGAGFFSRA